MPSAISRSDESKVAVGIALPQYGTIASPKTILHVAVEAEKMGLASLWTSDRLLLPTKPKGLLTAILGLRFLRRSMIQ